MPATIVRTRFRRAGAITLRIVAGFVAFLVLGNIAIVAASKWASGTTGELAVPALSGIDNLEAVDGRVWRGAAPKDVGYEALAASGVTTVVDLRSGDGSEADDAVVTELGMNLVRIPIRDGQTPSGADVVTFLQAVKKSPGLVFVHCGAGVGRTGAIVGAYSVSSGELNGRGALRRNLAVGPPSLEQMAYVANLEDGDYERPGKVITAVSRVLDAPRRIAHTLGL